MSINAIPQLEPSQWFCITQRPDRYLPDVIVTKEFFKHFKYEICKIRVDDKKYVFGLITIANYKTFNRKRTVPELNKLAHEHLQKAKAIIEKLYES